jgi:hypothetical protein
MRADEAGDDPAFFDMMLHDQRVLYINEVPLSQQLFFLGVGEFLSMF